MWHILCGLRITALSNEEMVEDVIHGLTRLEMVMHTKFHGIQSPKCYDYGNRIKQWNFVTTVRSRIPIEVIPKGQWTSADLG